MRQQVPDYDFLSLSATDFERLVCDVLNAELGLRLRTFPEGKDQGIDLREVAADDRIIIGQCKHYARTGKVKFLDAVSAETSKPGYLLASRYVFATTHPTSPAVEGEVAKILKIPIRDVWGPTALNDALRRHPSIVKSHFKLWLSSTAALERIFKAGLWNRTDALVEDIAGEARFWVETPAYTEAQMFLHSEGLCIITGLPGTGKTFLADRLLLNAVSEGWQAIKIRSPQDAWDVWDREAQQIFYYDDFLGQAQLELIATDQAPDLLMLMGRVRRHRDSKRLIMTSREQVMKQASQAASDRLEDITLDPARCSISLQDLDVATRTEILSTHLFFSELSDVERERISTDRRLISLAKHPSFNPRVIQEVTRHVREETVTEHVLEEMQQTFSNPQKLWRKSFRPLVPAAREHLLTLATLPPQPVSLAELRSLSNFTGSIWDWHQALKTLEPTWIRIIETEHERTAVFSNPSCRDYLLGVIDNPEYAEERLDRIQRIDQLLTLTIAAGLISANPQIQAATKRVHLAGALLSRRVTLASQVRLWSEELPGNSLTIHLQILRDIVSLLVVFGDPQTNGWLLEKISELVSANDVPATLPTVESMALARWISYLASMDEDMRDELIRKVVVAGLARANTSRDLAAYEDLPDALRGDAVHEVARQHAKRIIDTELELLITTAEDAHELTKDGEELQARARWYDHEVSLGDLNDRSAELMIENP